MIFFSALGCGTGAAGRGDFHLLAESIISVVVKLLMGLLAGFVMNHLFRHRARSIEVK